MPRVSVIVPAFNASATIESTLRSVLDGAYERFEIVVADDVSTDDTVLRVQSIADRRVRLVRASENGGPAAARNLALSHAQGELVAFLDSDDRWLPEFLERQVHLYDRSGPGVGIVSCDAWLVDQTGRRIGRHSEVVGSAAGAGLTEILAANSIYVSALCPRAMVEEAGRFSLECFGSEDHDLWLRILELGYRHVHNPEALALYAVAVEGISSSSAQMGRTEQATYRRALERGNLPPRAEKVARRRLRLAQAAERVETDGVLRSAPSLARVAIENPRLWSGWFARLRAR
jgi:teichuronic acid biosynthesis glycosyltransferase TuaG